MVEPCAQTMSSDWTVCGYVPSGSIALPSVPPSRGAKALAAPVNEFLELPGAVKLLSLGWYPQRANISAAWKFICLSMPSLLICEQSKGSDNEVALDSA